MIATLNLTAATEIENALTASRMVRHTMVCKCGFRGSVVARSSFARIGGKLESALIGDGFAIALDSARVKCSCGRRIAPVAVVGRVSDHVCSDKCLNSKGHLCECSCGGRNHGAGFAL